LIGVVDVVAGVVGCGLGCLGVVEWRGRFRGCVLGVVGGSGERAWFGVEACCLVSEPAAGSAGGGECSDAGEGFGEVVLPGPAGGEVQRPAAGVRGQPAGQGEQAAADGARGADDALG
jgi:hypothetical protein